MAILGDFQVIKKTETLIYDMFLSHLGCLLMEAIVCNLSQGFGQQQLPVTERDPSLFTFFSCCEFKVATNIFFAKYKTNKKNSTCLIKKQQQHIQIKTAVLGILSTKNVILGNFG